MGLIEQRSIIFEKLSLFKNSCKDLEKYITLHEKMGLMRIIMFTLMI